MRRTLLVVGVERHHPLNHLLHPPELRDGIPVVAVGLHPAHPDRGHGIQRGELIESHLGEPGLKGLAVKRGPVTKERVLQATALCREAHGLIGKERRAGWVIHKHAAVKAVEVSRAQE